MASSPRLPNVLEIEGTPETGTELRLTCPEPGVLEALCIAWFRYGDVTAPPFDTDISASPHSRVIQGASAALYTCGPEDVGKRLGATVRAAGNSATRWVLMPAPVRQLASSVEVRVRVMPHVHTKYCDRRVRVCTAAGRYREGATLRADVTGLGPELTPQYGVVWYRSTAPDPRIALARQPPQRPPALVLLSGAGSGSGSAAGGDPAAAASARLPMSPLASPLPLTSARELESPRLGGGIISQAWSLLSGGSRRNMVRSQSMGAEGAAAVTPGAATPSAAHAASAPPQHRGSVSNSGINTAALAGLTYVRVRPRSANELPPAPPDHLSSTPLPELKERLAALAAASAARAALSGDALPPPRPLPPPGAALGELEYALFAEDVDRLICCALVRLDAPGDVPAYIQPHGPAPKPKARSASAPDPYETLVPPGKTFQETQREWFAFPEPGASVAAGPAKDTPRKLEAGATGTSGSLIARGAASPSHRAFRDIQRELLVPPAALTPVLGPTPTPARVAASTGSVGASGVKAADVAATVEAGAASKTPPVHVDETWGDTPEKASSPGAAEGGGAPSSVSVTARQAAAGGDAPPVTAADVGSGAESPLSAPSPQAAGPPVGALRSDMRLSGSVGPIEAAPPRAREVWIDGVPAVGCLLTGHVYYYGGLEGSSEASWVAITDSGDTVELKRPTLCDPSMPLPELDAPVGSDADAHPRALRLTPDLLGNLIKFKIKPARSDGDVGHMESSRPTPEIAAASEEASAEARRLAAALRTGSAQAQARLVAASAAAQEPEPAVPPHAPPTSQAVSGSGGAD